MRILSVGTRKLNLSRFLPVIETTENKPDFDSGVLWGSTEIRLPGGNFTSEWKNFVGGDSSLIEKDKDYGISFTLHKNAKILEISSMEDYVKALKKYKFLNFTEWQLDFSKICYDYDAFHLTSNGMDELCYIPYSDPVYNNPKEFEKDGKLYPISDFRSYDIESWIIFRGRAINNGSVLTRNNISYTYMAY